MSEALFMLGTMLALVSMFAGVMGSVSPWGSVVLSVIGLAVIGLGWFVKERA